jgi:phosphopantothenate synthetase
MASEGEALPSKMHEIASNRRRVDSREILIADVALVSLGNGDRTENLEESET